jgi:N-acetylmuramoyl-L-alanine amidase
MVQQNMRVFKFAVIPFMAALVLLAGCSTSTQESLPPDYSDAGDNHQITNSPHLTTNSIALHPRLSAVVPSNQPPVQTAPVETWTSLNHWAMANKMAPPRHLRASPLSIWSLASPAGTLELAIGSHEATWNGFSLQLAFPPQMIDDQIYVHGLDLQKNLEPLLAGKMLDLPATNRVIVIDPGHGGVNAGTLNVLGGPPEKVFTLDWARRLAPLLESNGWTVFLTRTSDVDVSLLNRVAFAEAHHADLFISLHFNSSAPDKKQGGLETYCLTPTGMPSTLTRGYSDLWSDNYTNNAFDEQNLLLAMRLQTAILRASGEDDRGIRHARFMGVLHGQRRPAVLVEGGFLSNPIEAKRIGQPAFRQKLAEAIADALKPREDFKSKPID